MKKLIALLMAALMIMTMAACASEEAETATTAAPTAAPFADAPVDVLTNAWNLLPEDNKFFAMGGDFNAPVDNAPGVVTDNEYTISSLLVPEAELANVAEVANLVHAMNANTFTCGAYKLNSGADATAFTTAMETAISGNQWMCGFPEVLVVANIEGVIVVMFGLNDAVTPFQTALTEAYPTVQIVVNKPLV